MIRCLLELADGSQVVYNSILSCSLDLSVILDTGLYLLWLNATLFHIYLMTLCSDLTGFALANPILIGGPVLC